jgi:hypothetical protein
VRAKVKDDKGHLYRVMKSKRAYEQSKIMRNYIRSDKNQNVKKAIKDIRTSPY